MSGKMYVTALKLRVPRDLERIQLYIACIVQVTRLNGAWAVCYSQANSRFPSLSRYLNPDIKSEYGTMEEAQRALDDHAQVRNWVPYEVRRLDDGR